MNQMLRPSTYLLSSPTLLSYQCWGRKHDNFILFAIVLRLLYLIFVSFVVVSGHKRLRAHMLWPFRDVNALCRINSISDLFFTSRIELAIHSIHHPHPTLKMGHCPIYCLVILPKTGFDNIYHSVLCKTTRTRLDLIFLVFKKSIDLRYSKKPWRKKRPYIRFSTLLMLCSQYSRNELTHPRFWIVLAKDRAFIKRGMKISFVT